MRRVSGAAKANWCRIASVVRPPRRRGDQFALIGNHRCLDFVNTEGMQRGRRVDLLADLPDLVAWLTAAGLLGPAEADEALHQWSDTPAGARAFVEARKLRACLREMLEQTVRGQPIAASTVDAINSLLARRIGYAELVRTRDGFVRRLRLELRAPVDLLVPVAEAAGDFLCHADFSLVRKCANPPCLRYFYDLSKNHARRWCSMSVCGNRMKVAAYHRRAKRRPRVRS
jgi:predicted RNA-binding Zn ribbon-like protein